MGTSSGCAMNFQTSHNQSHEMGYGRKHVLQTAPWAAPWEMKVLWDAACSAPEGTRRYMDNPLKCTHAPKLSYGMKNAVGGLMGFAMASAIGPVGRGTLAIYTIGCECLIHGTIRSLISWPMECRTLHRRWQGYCGRTGYPIGLQSSHGTTHGPCGRIQNVPSAARAAVPLDSRGGARAIRGIGATAVASKRSEDDPMGTPFDIPMGLTYLMVNAIGSAVGQPMVVNIYVLCREAPGLPWTFPRPEALAAKRRMGTLMGCPMTVVSSMHCAMSFITPSRQSHGLCTCHGTPHELHDGVPNDPWAAKRPMMGSSVGCMRAMGCQMMRPRDSPVRCACAMDCPMG